uniref:SREBP regulating gene protein n=1 Tax=Macrostomum lignano TaxID=282301 RepID=A0A1I8H574_9PLAT
MQLRVLRWILNRLRRIYIIFPILLLFGLIFVFYRNPESFSSGSQDSTEQLLAFKWQSRHPLDLDQVGSGTGNTSSAADSSAAASKNFSSPQLRLSQRSVRYHCSACNQFSLCCKSFESCVSCCLQPNQRPILEAVLLRARALGDKVLLRVADPFQLCLARCRTSSESVQHENAYRDPVNKHCFGLQPPTLRLANPATLQHPASMSEKPFAQRWLNNAYQDSLQPTSQWQRASHLLAERLANSIEAEPAFSQSDRFKQMTFQLLGEVFVRNYFPHDSIDPGVITPPNIAWEDRRTLDTDCRAWLDAKLQACIETLPPE